MLPLTTMQTLQREFWDGHPVALGTGFWLRKRKGDRELRAVCSLQTHQLGWEIRLEVQGLLSRPKSVALGTRCSTCASFTQSLGGHATVGDHADASREFWDGHPVSLGVGFGCIGRKVIESCARSAICKRTSSAGK